MLLFVVQKQRKILGPVNNFQALLKVLPDLTCHKKLWLLKLIFSYFSPRPSTPSRSRSRTITPPEKVQANDFKRNGHQRILSQEEEEEDMLDFEDEIDPAIVEEAAKVNVQRLQIKPPDVDDLNLKDEAGGGICFLHLKHHVAFLHSMAVG